jgi:hypothetical protein
MSNANEKVNDPVTGLATGSTRAERRGDPEPATTAKPEAAPRLFDPSAPHKLTADGPAGAGESGGAAPLSAAAQLQDDFPDDLDFEADSDFEDEDYYDCGIYCDKRGRPISCSALGSEQCDFECPNRDWLLRSIAQPARKGAAKRGSNTELTHR